MIFAPRHAAEVLTIFGEGRNFLMYIAQGPFFGVLFHIL